SGHISLSPETYGLLPAEADQLQAATDLYVEALRITSSPSTRTSPAIANKNDTAAELRRVAGLISSRIQGMATVTDAQKIALGLTVRKPRVRRLPAPEHAPELMIEDAHRHRVAIRLIDRATGRRGRPADVAGATVFSYVGEKPNADTLRGWDFETSTARTKLILHLDPALPPGTKVWLRAFWTNRRCERGPLCNPVATRVQFPLTA